ncbi:MAG: glycosyltransferase family 2 protein [Opitutae bacterium]|nr:glycosyltransferase family 2 protein [Opitutae bacterium]
MESAFQPAATILIACRDEEDNIVPCLESVVSAMPEAEVLVMDGGNDRTRERATVLAQKHPNIRIIPHLPDRGKGHAIRDGIALARAQAMAQFDADRQFDAADLPALLAPVQAGLCDLCVGSRFLPGSSWTTSRPSLCRDFGNRLLAGWVSLLTGRRATDVTSGMKAWSRTAIAQIDFRDEGYCYEAEIVVRAARLGLRIREIPVRYSSRVAGVSMHRNRFALAKAGGILALKCLHARGRRS